MRALTFRVVRFATLVACLSLLTAPVAFAELMVPISVGQNDTLLGLCKTHLGNPRRDCGKISRLNNLKNPDLIYPKQKIMVPLELLKSTPLAGIVTFVKGEAFVEQMAGGSRRPLALDEKLPEGGRISTGEHGAVEVSYEDGTRFFLTPDSSLDLTSSRKKGDVGFFRELWLRTGLIVTKIKKITGKEQRFDVITPSAVSGARGTEFRVAVDKGDTTRSEVLEGVVGVKGQNSGITVNGGQGTLVRKGEAPLPPRTLLPPPVLINHLPIYKADPLRIRFEAAAGTTSIRAALARDPLMKDVVREGLLAPSAPFAITNLDDGTYYLQGRGVDEIGLEGMPSQPLPLVIRFNPRPPNLQAPAGGATFHAQEADFRWLKVNDAVAYHLQIARDTTFAATVVDAGQVADVAYHAAGLEYGSYFYRVASRAADGYEGDWSDAVPFTLMPPPPVPAMAAPEQSDREIRIRVKDAGEGMTYRFQVARDPGFGELLTDTTVAVPEVVFPRPGSAGIYLVRCQCIDATGYAGPFAAPQSFEIKREFSPLWYGVGVVGAIGVILGIAL